MVRVNWWANLHRSMALSVVLTMPAAAAAPVSSTNAVPVEVKRALALGDRDLALPWLRSAASAGNHGAALMLAKFYLRADAGPGADVAIGLLSQAADGGLVEAEFLLATQYQKAGELNLAKQYYQRAEKNGHPRAERRIASLARHRSTEDAFAAIAAGERVSERLVSAQAAEKNASNRSLLAHAVLNDAQDWIDALLRLGVDPDVVDDQGNSALHHAVLRPTTKGGNSLISRLLASGADPKLANASDSTALHLAVTQNRPDAARALIAAGARKTLKDAQGWTPEMLAERQGHPAMLAVFGKGGAKRAPKTRLVSENADAALQNGIAAQDITLVEAALSAQAHVDVLDDSGNSSLALVAQAGNVVLVKLLTDKSADIELVNAHGDTPLMLAAGGGHHQVVEHLLKLGGKIDVANVSGKTALHQAARGKHSQVVQQLIKRGASINVLDSSLRTPLWWAVRQSDAVVAAMLLKQGADLRPDRESVAPQHLAARQGDAELLVDMLASVAPAETELLDVRTQTGNTPIMLAAHNNAAGAIRALIDHKADIEAVNNVGDSALLIATRNKSLDAARLLVDAGASLNRRNHQLVSARMLIEKDNDSQWLSMMEAAPSELSSLLSRWSGN